MKLAFVDTETTGLNPEIAEVIEIAIIRVEPGSPPTYYQTLIRPERIELAHPKALEINGYAANSERWDDAPLMSDVGDFIVDTLKGFTLVGHNIAFDETMLNANLYRASIHRRVPYRKIDTQMLAMEHLYPLGLKRTSMDSIRTFLDWDAEGAHTAMKDAKDAKKLFDLLWRVGAFRKLKLKGGLWWNSCQQRLK